MVFTRTKRQLTVRPPCIPRRLLVRSLSTADRGRRVTETQGHGSTGIAGASEGNKFKQLQTLADSPHALSLFGWLWSPWQCGGTTQYRMSIGPWQCHTARILHSLQKDYPGNFGRTDGVGVDFEREIVIEKYYMDFKSTDSLEAH
jgi:hypothetical protein